jgi:3-deoxy-manno-octulosonate cytidylyltransferase (CMP-KDO synthetase)
MECIEFEAGQQADVVVMIQGDEPLILPETIAGTLDRFSYPTVEIANIMSSLRALESFIDQNNVKKTEKLMNVDPTLAPNI